MIKVGKKKCFVNGCSSVQPDEDNSPISFHRLFTPDPITYKRRLEAISTLNNQTNVENHPKSAKICAKHYSEDCFMKNTGPFVPRLLYSNAVPSIFAPPKNKIQNIEYIAVDVPLHTINNNIIVTTEAPPNNSTSSNFNNLEKSTETLTRTTSVNRIKTIRYSGDIKDIDNASPETLIYYVQFLQKLLEDKTREIRKLRRIISRYQKRELQTRKI